MRQINFGKDLKLDAWTTANGLGSIALGSDGCDVNQLEVPGVDHGCGAEVGRKMCNKCCEYERSGV